VQTRDPFATNDLRIVATRAAVRDVSRGGDSPRAHTSVRHDVEN
jgi:hypothetical protein